MRDPLRCEHGATLDEPCDACVCPHDVPLHVVCDDCDNEDAEDFEDWDGDVANG